MSNHHRSLVHDHRIPLQDFDLFFMAASPMVSHCHYFNLFFDQIVDDALGWELGREVRVDSAYEAGSQLLNAFILDMPPTTLSDRLDLASSIFAGMGLGTLEFDLSRERGIVIGRHLHYGSSLRREHGTQRNRSHPADAVASGFIAAAVETAYGLPLGSVFCTETSCMASSSADQCEFEVARSGHSGEVFGVTESDIIKVLPASVDSLNEGRIRDLTVELREFVLAGMADKRGLIENFGVYLAHHMGNYYNHCSNRMLAILAEEKPSALEVAQELLRESGQRDGYFTFGGILASAEWEALVASFRDEPQVIIDGCMAMARALGFGHWCVESYAPEQKLVLVSPGTYESAYRKVAALAGKAGCCYAYQGAAVAVMDLAHAVDWHQTAPIGQANYQALRSSGTWKVAETHCLAAGDDVCRAVVERS